MSVKYSKISFIRTNRVAACSNWLPRQWVVSGYILLAACSKCGIELRFFVVIDKSFLDDLWTCLKAGIRI